MRLAALVIVGVAVLFIFSVLKARREVRRSVEGVIRAAVQEVAQQAAFEPKVPIYSAPDKYRGVDDDKAETALRARAQSNRVRAAELANKNAKAVL